MRNFVVLLVTLVIAPLAPASAAEQLVRGRLFVVSDPLPGSSSSPRHISIRTRDVGRASIVGDPLANGCTIRVIANGATSSDQTFVLPAGGFQEPDGPGWTKFAKRRRTSYSYVDERGDNGPVTSFVIRQVGARLTITATLDTRGDGAVPIDVVPPDPGTDGGMIVSIDGGDTYCVAFGGSARGKITSNDSVRFRVVNPRGEGCPTVPGGSASAAFVD